MIYLIPALVAAAVVAASLVAKRSSANRTALAAAHSKILREMSFARNTMGYPSPYSCEASAVIPASAKPHALAQMSPLGGAETKPVHAEADSVSQFVREPHADPGAEYEHALQIVWTPSALSHLQVVPSQPELTITQLVQLSFAAKGITSAKHWAAQLAGGDIPTQGLPGGK
jgi:hypothetical protein